MIRVKNAVSHGFLRARAGARTRRARRGDGENLRRGNLKLERAEGGVGALRSKRLWRSATGALAGEPLNTRSSLPRRRAGRRDGHRVCLSANGWLVLGHERTRFISHAGGRRRLCGGGVGLKRHHSSRHLGRTAVQRAARRSRHFTLTSLLPPGCACTWCATKCSRENPPRSLRPRTRGVSLPRLGLCQGEPGG